MFALDSGYVRPGFDAIHLIIESGRAAIVDTGTSHSVPSVLAALADVGIGVDEVDWVILTHVHLDHAGGAGALMQCLPNARLAVHPHGAPHMADPARLWQASCEVYGDARARAMYGELQAVDPARIVEAGEDTRLRLAGRELQCLDAPGHARHHLVLRDTGSGDLFAGDTFGISYREFDVDSRAFAFPSSTPVQFDPNALCASIERMLRLAPRRIYLTHYSGVEDIATLGARLLRLVERYAAIALAHERAGEAREAMITDDLRALLIGELRVHGCMLDDARIHELIAMDLELNAAGLLCWLDRRQR